MNVEQARSLTQWCHQRGMSFQEYDVLAGEIYDEANALVAAASALRRIGTGMYYPVEELVPAEVWAHYEECGLLGCLFTSLIADGVEFYDNRSLYRI